MAISVATAQLIGTLLDAIGYGIYLALLPQGFNVLRKKGIRGRLMTYLFFTLLVSFLTITVHIGSDIARVMEAFTVNSNQTFAAERYYENLATSLNVTKNSCYIIITMVSDALIVFRTFILWENNPWVIAIPALLLGADIDKPEQRIIHAPTWDLVKYFSAVTLALNVLCTVLLAYRIWRTQRMINRLWPRKNRTLCRAFGIVVETAAIYSVSLFAILGMAIAESPCLFIVLNPMPPLIGIVFFYIVLRSSTNNQYTAELQTLTYEQSSSITPRDAQSDDANPRAEAELLVLSPTKDDTRPFSPIGVELRLEGVIHTGPARS
ncbi:unnamed protein product [Somion occarium]|uniref:Uncharacterized protein n=1 Tax=Somion occarium TaxID=3059160 RepID=A0ABP1DKB3_9APHY